MHTKNLMDLAGTTRPQLPCRFNLFPPGGRVHIFFLGLQDPPKSGARNYRTKKNSEHWMQDEVRQLVDVVSEYGVRKWKDVKTNFFIASIQTPLYLKVHVDAQ